MASPFGAGRGRTRPAWFLAVLAVAVAAVALLRGGPERAVAREVARPNPHHAAPVESLVGTVRHVFHTSAPSYLVIDSAHPREPATLMWFQGFPVSRGERGDAFALDGAGGVVRFDQRLAPHRLRLELNGREPLSVVADAGGGYWFSDLDGSVHRLSSDGVLLASVPTGFDRPVAVGDPGGGVWLARSTRLFAFRMATPDDPLLLRLAESDTSPRAFGAIRVPEHVVLAELANAGHVAVTTHALFFAPFIRDDIVAFSRDGDTLWVAHRGLPQSTAEPRFEIGPDGPMIDYAPVNLGLSLGPDGLLYVISVAGGDGLDTRLDVFDPASGALLRSATLGDPLPTIALGESGRVYRLDPFQLLTGVAPAEREPVPAFTLDRLGGGSMSSHDLRGEVTLVNFWASWCAPCRAEMPALDELRRSIAHPDFAFLTMNEDIDTDDAAGFIAEFGFDFPVLLGRGRLRQSFHYYGLPFTLLIDREGQVVQRWIGYAGDDQIAAIRAVVMTELLRGPGGTTQPMPEHGGHGGTAGTSH